MKYAQENTITDYLSGYQYVNNELQFFPTAEGYVNFASIPELQEYNKFTYVYNYTDHLGNIRVSYTQNPQNPDALVILEENNYYPFGLKHNGYNKEIREIEFAEYLATTDEDQEHAASYNITILPAMKSKYKYKYNGKEFQDELGLNFYDYGARNYDAALGRWFGIDPLAETSRRWNPYTYCYNNPLRFIDPDGMSADPPDKANQGDFQKGDKFVDKTGEYIATTVTDEKVIWSKVNVDENGDPVISQSKTQIRGKIEEFFHNMFSGTSFSWNGNAPQEFLHIYSGNGLGRNGEGDMGYFQNGDKLIFINWDDFVKPQGGGYSTNNIFTHFFRFWNGLPEQTKTTVDSSEKIAEMFQDTIVRDNYKYDPAIDWSDFNGHNSRYHLKYNKYRFKDSLRYGNSAGKADTIYDVYPH